MPRAVASIAVFVVMCAVYWQTLAPTVGPTDSGELTVAAWTFGNAHPPGFPLYLLATRAVMSVTPGAPAWRANVASAIFGAAAAAVMTLAAMALLHALRGERSREDACIAAAAGLLLGVSPTLWNYATVAEVYTFNAMLMVGAWGCLIVWHRIRASHWLYAAAILFGFGLAVHHVTIGLGAIAIAFLVVRTGTVSLLRTKTAAIAVALALGGLLFYAYLPWAASREPFLNWGDPKDLSRLFDHVAGKQYRSYLSSARASGQLGFALSTIAGDLGPFALPLLLAIAGLVALWMRSRALFGFLLLIAAASLAWSAAYPIANDRDAYLIPVTASLLLAAAAGAAWLLERVRSERLRTGAAAALLLLPIAGCALHWNERDRSDYRANHDLAMNALAPAGPNALLLTGQWQLYAPLMSLQETEGVRRDVEAVFVGMLIRSWYLDAIARRYPLLARDVQDELASFRESVDLWERTPPERWAVMDAERAEFFRRLNALLLAMIERHHAGGPVLATRDVIRSAEAVWQPSVQAIASRYDLVPSGVVWQIAPRGAAPSSLPEVALVTRGIAGSGDAVVTNEIAPEYFAAFLARARHLVATREYERAVAEYDRALAFDRGNVTIERERNLVAARQ